MNQGRPGRYFVLECAETGVGDGLRKLQNVHRQRDRGFFGIFTFLFASEIVAC